MSEATIPIKELMEKTEQWLLGQGSKTSTLGFSRATWNRFLSYSASPAYSRETAEQFLLQYCGVDVHAIDPVSYTHLDVYKRQDLPSVVDTFHRAHRTGRHGKFIVHTAELLSLIHI